MQAVILAAGNGSRLRSIVGAIPKCLAELGGRPLIHNTLEVFDSLGIEEICVVLGYQAEMAQESLGCRCEVIRNDRYAETNSLYSLWLTRNWVQESFVLINGDVVADPRIYRRLLEAPGTALAYDSTSGDEDEHMKVALSGDGRVRRIAKSISPELVDGESIGLIKFEAPAVRPLFDAAAAVLDEGGIDEWAPAALDRLAAHEEILGVDSYGLPWVEIDFPEDLSYARTHVWPALRPASREAVGSVDPP